MKAIMINSQLKTVYNCHLSKKREASSAELYDRLECRTFAIAHTFKRGDALFVDDEGMLDMNDETTFFQVEGCQVLAGNGVIMGPEIEFDDGDYTVEDVTFPIEDLKIKFFTMEDVSLPDRGVKIYGL